MQYIALDGHKRYTLASVQQTDGHIAKEERIEHEPGAIRDFLKAWDPGSPVALETIGNWYWIIDEIEAAGMTPKLVHARKAKLMMGMINKTDTLDARGLNRLQQTGTLPTVWIAPGELRDRRDLPRTRMVLSQERTRLKNRIHATLAKYGLKVAATDAFGPQGRPLLEQALTEVPTHTRFASQCLLEQLTTVEKQISRLEERMRQVFGDSLELNLLMSLPGVGFILGTLLWLEIGDIHRFPSASHLASYAGTTPRVHSSGGKTRIGQLRSDVNRYLKWAYVEAANSVCLNHLRRPERHVSRLYQRIHHRRGHPKAIGAVARHLAEATYWILHKKELYREPKGSPAHSTER